MLYYIAGEFLLAPAKTIFSPLKPDTNKRFISTPWHHQLMMTDQVFLWRFDFSILFFVASLDPISFAYLWKLHAQFIPCMSVLKNMKQLKVHMTRLSLRFIYLCKRVKTTVQTLKQQSACFFKQENIYRDELPNCHGHRMSSEHCVRKDNS